MAPTFIHHFDLTHDLERKATRRQRLKEQINSRIQRMNTEHNKPEPRDIDAAAACIDFVEQKLFHWLTPHDNAGARSALAAMLNQHYGAALRRMEAERDEYAGKIEAMLKDGEKLAAELAREKARADAAEEHRNDGFKIADELRAAVWSKPGFTFTGKNYAETLGEISRMNEQINAHGNISYLTRAEKAEAELAAAHREAAHLAEVIFKRHYASDEAYTSGRSKWGLCDTVAGIISQIDNMHAGVAQELSAARAEVKWLKEGRDQWKSAAEVMQGAVQECAQLRERNERLAAANAQLEQALRVAQSTFATFAMNGGRLTEEQWATAQQTVFAALAKVAEPTAQGQAAQAACGETGEAPHCEHCGKPWFVDMPQCPKHPQKPDEDDRLIDDVERARLADSFLEEQQPAGSAQATDTQRLDWLEKHGPLENEDVHSGETYLAYVIEVDPPTLSLRAAIDAAMARADGQKGGQ